NGKTWVRDKHFVARLEYGEQGVEQHRLGPRNDDNVLCTHPYAAPRKRRGNRIAQREQAGRVHVTGVAIVQGTDGCLDYVGRRSPVRLADLEVNHVAPCLLEAARRSQHLERAFAREGDESTGWNDGHGPPPPKQKRPLQ